MNVSNSTLTTLDLTNTKIGDSGASALSDSLKSNIALKTLILRTNKIGDSGAASLCDSLKLNSTLITLDLDRNPSISDSSLKTQIADEIGKNKSLFLFILSTLRCN